MNTVVRNWIVQFINAEGEDDETELSTPIDSSNHQVELFNLILSLKDEMGIAEVTDIYDNGQECIN